MGTFSESVGFRGEEFGVQSAADTTWLVGPIDGTSHFIRGMPFCTSMMALIENGEVMLAVIHDIASQDTYWAVRGKGAYCNDRRIQVSDRSLSEAVVSFETRTEIPEYAATYQAVRKKAGIFEALASGFEFIMIASGKLDGKIALNLYGSDWDFAPGSLLVSEAGGVAANIGTATYDYKNHDFLIMNQAIYQELTSGDAALFPVAD